MWRSWVRIPRYWPHRRGVLFEHNCEHWGAVFSYRPGPVRYGWASRQGHAYPNNIMRGTPTIETNITLAKWFSNLYSPSILYETPIEIPLRRIPHPPLCVLDYSKLPQIPKIKKRLKTHAGSTAASSTPAANSAAQLPVTLQHGSHRSYLLSCTERTAISVHNKYCYIYGTGLDISYPGRTLCWNIVLPAQPVQNRARSSMHYTSTFSVSASLVHNILPRTEAHNFSIHKNTPLSHFARTLWIKPGSYAYLPYEIFGISFERGLACEGKLCPSRFKTSIGTTYQVVHIKLAKGQKWNTAFSSPNFVCDNRRVPSFLAALLMMHAILFSCRLTPPAPASTWEMIKQ